MFPNSLCFLMVLVAFASLSCAEDGSNNLISSRIINGEPAEEDEFPYFAQLIALQEDSQYEYTVICGATLIDARFALTAAHCLIGDEEIVMMLGTNNVNDTVNAEKRWVDEYWWHEGFNFDTLRHDIGLVRMKDPVEYSKAVMPIKLYCYNGDTPADTLVQVAGDGLVNETTQQLATTLQFGNFKTITTKVCRDAYSIVTSENICAVGTTNQFTCNGDSGAAMVQRTSYGLIQIGIVSYGSSAGCQVDPGVYTRVSNYTSWIKARMSENVEEICANPPVL